MPENGSHPPEFEIDTAGAAPLGEYDVPEHLEQLWALRGGMTRRARSELQTTIRLEEAAERVGKELRQCLAVAVANADDLRQVVEELGQSRPSGDGDDANDESQETPAQPADEPSSGWLARVFGRGPESETKARPAAPASSAEWAEVLGRLWRSTRGNLERIGVHYVPLRGGDLREARFQDQPVKRWVSVKNTAAGEELRVAQEIQGLWIRVEGEALAPVQRGEVLVE